MRRIVAVAIPIVSTAVLVAGALVEDTPSDLKWIPLVAASTAVGALLWYRRAGRAIGPPLGVAPLGGLRRPGGAWGPPRVLGGGWGPRHIAVPGFAPGAKPRVRRG